LARFCSFLACFLLFLADLRADRLLSLPACRAFSVAAATSGLSVATALPQPLDAASFAFVAAGCTRSTAAANVGPTLALVS
jgi:hypothetical protein